LNLPRLYRDLAAWWPLFSSTSDYRLETRAFGPLLSKHGSVPATTVLELGSGGGNNAWYLKRRFTMTLADLSRPMLKVSRRLNPECEHVQGDMRHLRLGRVFDRVFIHDAIMHMTTERDLALVARTAFLHTRPGGAAVIAPDCTRETYAPLTHHAGNDGGDRGFRYLEWNFDPDPEDSTYEVHFAYLLREPSGRVRAVQDLHRFGLFSQGTWMRVLKDAGFKARRVDDPVLRRDVFVGVRPI
jgi:SAM-dependent methyltransferase